MAFPLAAIGAGLGLGADAITRQREAEMRRAQMMLLQQQMQQQMQEDQRKREALGAMFGLFSNPGSSFTPAGPPSTATNPLGLTGPAMQMPQASQPAPRSPTPAVPGGDQMGDMAPPDVAKLAGLATTNVFPPDHVRLANFDAPSEFSESGQQSLPPALRPSDPRTGSANPFSWITGGAAPAPVNPSALLAPGRSMSNPLGAVGSAGSAGGIMGAAADASKAAIGLRTSVDPMEMGRMQIPQLAKRIDELYPGLDPVVKGMALQFSAKMLAPDQAATLRAWMQENNANLRVALAEFQAKNAAERTAQAGGSVQMVGDKPMWVKGGIAKPLTDEKGTPIEGPVTKPQAALPPQLEVPDKWEGMPDKAPPGVRQDVWESALFYVRTGQMPAMGFQPGIRNLIVQAAPAARHALGIKASEGAEAAAQYAGERHGMIVAGGRSAQIGFGIQEALKAAPQVISTSEAVPRTEFPKANEFWNWLQTSTGSPETVRFKEALNTYLNIYAATVSRTGRLTDSQQRHAYELLSTAFSRGQIQAGIEQLNYEMELMREAVPEAIKEIPGQFQPKGIAPEAPKAIPPSAAPAATGTKAAPAVGAVQDGYRFKGGDPADPKNWEKVQ